MVSTLDDGTLPTHTDDDHGPLSRGGRSLPPDPRLVVTDMDGTLLDGDGLMPEGLGPLIAELQSRGIVFAVASGRQFASLSRLFAPDDAGVVFIAENGAYVVRDEDEISSSPLDRGHAERVVHTVRELSRRVSKAGVSDASGPQPGSSTDAPPAHDVGLVWCGRRAAYIERRDASFVRAATQYYANLVIVDDLLQVAESPLKFAVFDFDGTRSGSLRVLEGASGPFQVVASSEH